MKWISVNDRLPERDETCLCCYHFSEGGPRYIQTLTYFATDPVPHWQHEGTGLKVTHWIPIPELPKED